MIGLVIRRYSIHIYDILYISMIQGINCDLDPGLDRRKWKEMCERNKVSVQEITA